MNNLSLALGALFFGRLCGAPSHLSWMSSIKTSHRDLSLIIGRGF